MTLLARVRSALSLNALLALSATAQARPCDEHPVPLAPSRDLYCIELGPPAGPFTIGVTVDGVMRVRPTFILANLPAPDRLGPFTTYVAWAAPAAMYPVLRLGEVRNGRTTLPALDLEKYVVLVTAEAADDVAEPRGAVVLRGQSPTTRLQPPDLQQFVFGSMLDSAEARRAAEHSDHGAQHASHDAHEHHAMDTLPATTRWTTVPMPPGLQMLPAEMALRPNVAAYLPHAPDGSAPPAARPRRLVRLSTGDTLHLTAQLVTRTFK
ncbi:MAG TPA: hypothetical protein VKJ07_23560, partial [Mycobacteriales bacterium]|nr:hypothetical protein [Mycobacteriales bacterium]